VCFAIEHTVALLDNPVSDGLGAVALTTSSWTEEQCVFATTDPCGSGQIEDETAVHLWIKLEVEIVKAFVSVTELGLLVAPLQQSFAATGKFVRDQDGDQVDGGHGLRLSL